MIYHCLVGCITVSFVVALIDLFRGSPWGVGNELQRGFDMAGPLLLLMTGYICLAPVLAAVLKPSLLPLAHLFGVDPSFAAGLCLAVDSGGAPLAMEMADSHVLGKFSGYVVGSVLGPTLTFTVPVALMGKKLKESIPIINGLMAGIIASPIGIFVGGLLLGLPLGILLKQMVPLVLFVLFLTVLLQKYPHLMAAFLVLLAKFSLIVSYGGLACVLIQKVLSYSILPDLLPFEDAIVTIGGIALLLGGAYPFVVFIHRLTASCLDPILIKFGFSEEGAAGLMMTVVNSMAMFSRLGKMSENDVVLNTAFAVSGAWLLGDHFCFVAQVEPGLLMPVFISKLVASLASLCFARFVLLRQ